MYCQDCGHKVKSGSIGMVEFARRELEKAGLFAPDSDYGGMLGNSVMKLIEAFANSGHSGFSALLTRQLFEKLATRQLLKPCEHEDIEVATEDGWQLCRYCYKVWSPEGVDMTPEAGKVAAMLVSKFQGVY